MDIEAGTSETLDVPELAAGDPPYSVVRRDHALVFWGYSTHALDVDHPSAAPSTLAEDSWYFVPSARSDRVWVVVRDQAKSTPHHYVFSEVRELTFSGEVTAEGPALGDAWMNGAVDAGVVFETSDGLVVCDPIQQEVVRTFGSGPMAASHGNTVVWCEAWCPELHLTDVLTGVDRTVQPPAGFDRFDGWSGEFTPDGRLFAVPVGNPPRYEGAGAIALVNVTTGEPAVIAGSGQEMGIPSLTWDASGTRLFFVPRGQSEQELRYFDLDSHRIQNASVRPPDDFVALVAD